MKKDTIEKLTEFYNLKSNKEYTEYVELESFLRECTKLEKAIKNHKLVIVSKNKDYTQFDIFTIEKDGLSRLYPITKQLVGYTYRKDTQYVSISAVGTSRTLEIIMHLARAVGLDEMTTQRQIII